MADRPIPIYRLIALPVIFAAIIFLETQRPFGFFRAFSFLLLFFLLVDLVTLLRGRLRDFLLMSASLVLGLTAVEAISGLSAPEPQVLIDNGYNAVRPVLGWGPQRPGRFHAHKADPQTGKTIYDVTYTIDQNLLRETMSCARCKTFAFFGDSFTFGEGLNDADTLPQAFADAFDRKVRVLNLGFSGYGPQQFLREMQTGLFDKIIGPQPQLFVFLTAAWHAQRSACKASWVLYAPRYVLENGTPIYKGPCAQGPTLWLRQWVEHSALYRRFVEPLLERVTHADIELYIRELNEATRIAKEKYNVPLLIPYIRTPGYLRSTGFTDDEIIKRLKDGGALVIDVSLAQEEAQGLPIIIPNENHPTGLANRLRAAILKSYIAGNLPAISAPISSDKDSDSKSGYP
jgi:hypothetical protein